MTGISQVDIIKNSGIAVNSHSQWKSGYVTVCQICGWYGYPEENIVVEFEGIRPEDEDGFVDKFTEYDNDTETAKKGTKHIHKYDPQLVKEAVDLALKMRTDGGCQE
jgi:hypothetical protein